MHGLRHRRTVRHYDEPYQPHGLTFSCYQRRPFLSRERTCIYMAEALVSARRNHPFHLWAYVFMPEHVHLIIWPAEEGASTASFLKAVKQSASRKAIGWLRCHNPVGLTRLATGDPRFPYAFWQDGPGHDHNLVSSAELRNFFNYIHANPVSRGLCAYPEEWKWSSALDWSGQGRGPLPLDLDSFPVL